MAATFGRYTLLRRVGTGGMAEIWKAKVQGPAGFEKELALKKVLSHLVSDQAFVQMFIEEAKLAAQLAHPNVVQVFDFGRIGQDYFIAMEYVPGTNLAHVLRRLGEKGSRVPMEIALYIALEAAKGLGYAHEKTDQAGNPLSIVHRDVSPQNILVSYTGEVKIADFGIAKAASAMSHTGEGQVRGKLSYMSPEQAHTQPLDGRSDLFALGLVLYELLTGRRLFSGGSSSEIYSRVASYQAPNKADFAKLPSEVATILETTLQKDPNDRYADAHELEAALMMSLGPEGMLQAKPALSSILQRLFADERKLEHTPVPSDLADAIDESLSVPTQSSGAMQGVAVDPGKATIVTPASGLTLAKGKSQPAIQVREEPVPQKRGGGRTLFLGILLILIAAAVGVGSRYLPMPGKATATPIAASTTPASTSTPEETATPAKTATPRATATKIAVAKTPAPTPTPAPAQVKIANGYLNVNARPWVEVWVDGKRVARETPLRRHALPAGKHRLTFVNADLKVRIERDIQIPADGEISLFVDAKAGKIEFR